MTSPIPFAILGALLFYNSIKAIGNTSKRCGGLTYTVFALGYISLALAAFILISQ